MQKVIIEKSWKKKLRDQFDSQYMINLGNFLRQQKKIGRIILPKGGLIFRAFDLTPFEKVKVVIIGQDPYHGHNQANGLSFSVSSGTQLPPSLKNIFKELFNDLQIPISEHGDLQFWAKQGVLLLNSCLTVEHARPGSHKNIGWEQFTDAIINILNEEKTNLVFVLWGALSRLKGKAISREKHLVIESSHPSPLSAHNGFFGSKPFSKTNKYLTSKNVAQIDWNLNIDHEFSKYTN